MPAAETAFSASPGAVPDSGRVQGHAERLAACAEIRQGQASGQFRERARVAQGGVAQRRQRAGGVLPGRLQEMART
jgi:hypothetical protein